jgi:hypothetical protein
MTTRDELLAQLSELLPSQFEAVLFRAQVPTEHLPGTSAPQATRAMNLIRYFELQSQLERLTCTIAEVVPPIPTQRQTHDVRGFPATLPASSMRTQAVQIDLDREAALFIANKSTAPVFRELIAPELSQFRTLFSGTRAQISLLGKYKELHDVLQDLEQPFGVVLREQKRLLSSKEAWGKLRDPLDSMELLVDKTLRVLEHERLRDEFATSRQRLDQASNMLRAVDAGDHGKLRGAIFHLERVLAVETSSANNRLLTTTRELRLGEVVAALRSVYDSIQHRATRASLEELDQLVASLDRQHRQLEALVQEHDQWQGVGNELRLVIGNPRLSREEAQLSWDLVRSRLAVMLDAAADATWVSIVRPAVTKVERTLEQGTGKNHISCLRGLWRRCNQRFVDVDKQLLRTCEELQRAGDTLDALLKVIQ